MPIPVRCPCGNLFAAAASHAANSVQCPQCGRSILIPSAPPPVIALPPIRPPIAAGTRPTAPANSSWTPRKILLIFFLALTAFACIAASCAGLIFFHWATDPRPKITLDIDADWSPNGVDTHLDDRFRKNGIATRSGQPLTAHFTAKEIRTHTTAYVSALHGDQLVRYPDIEGHFWITNAGGVTLWERRWIRNGAPPGMISADDDAKTEVWEQFWADIDAMQIPPASFVANPPSAPPPGAIQTGVQVYGP